MLNKDYIKELEKVLRPKRNLSNKKQVKQLLKELMKPFILNIKNYNKKG